MPYTSTINFKRSPVGKTWLPELEGKCGGSSKTFVWEFLDGKHDISGIVLKPFYRCSRIFRDIYRTLNGTFYEGCSTIVP